MILKASAAKGSSSLTARADSEPSLGLIPSIGGLSSGEGRKSTTASSIGWTPLFFSAEPQSTGTCRVATVPARRPRTISSWVSSSPSRYFTISSSSLSATASSITLRYFSTSVSIPAGMSLRSMVVPRSSA